MEEKICFKFENNSHLALDKDNAHKFVVASKNPSDNDLERINNYLTYDFKNVINSYKDLIKLFRDESKLYFTKYYIFYIIEESLYAFRKLQNTNLFELLCIYKFENEQLKDYFKKILRLDDKKEYASTISEISANFAVIAPWQILDVILTREYILSQNEIPFNKFKHKSKNGKIREIIAPHEDIKNSLKTLNYLLQKVYDNRNSTYQVAYKKGKNVLSGAGLHKNDKYVFNLDIHDFFPSCKIELVKKYTDFLFTSIYNREFIETEFLDTITDNGGLFIGSPISGTIANAIMSRPVQYLNNICKKYDMNLSVYADDISFSSNKFISKDFAESLFNLAFSKYDLDKYFTLNSKKSVGFTGSRRKVTGVSINDSNMLTVPRKYYTMLRTRLEHLANGKKMDISVQQLRGQIAYATMVDESGKVYRYLNKYLDTVQQYNLCSDAKLEELGGKFNK